MGRKPGSLLRASCVKCGAVELRRGCTAGFLCISCNPNRRDTFLKYSAHHQVANAIKAGALPRPTGLACADCGGAAIEYEHRDYYKPLEVEPICRRCNLLRGPAIGANDRVPKAA